MVLFSIWRYFEVIRSLYFSSCPSPYPEFPISCSKKTFSIKKHTDYKSSYYKQMVLLNLKLFQQTMKAIQATASCWKKTTFVSNIKPNSHSRQNNYYTGFFCHGYSLKFLKKISVITSFPNFKLMMKSLRKDTDTKYIKFDTFHEQKSFMSFMTWILNRAKCTKQRNSKVQKLPKIVPFVEILVCKPTVFLNYYIL